MEQDRCPRQTPRPPEVHRGIYVAGFGIYIKIGISADVHDRVATLQTPEEVKLYAILDGWLNEERKLHRQFAEYRLRGEWFRHEGELAKWVTRISIGLPSRKGIAKHGRSKLTEAEVLAIRAEKGVPRGELAVKYGISRSQIHHIRTGQNWKLIGIEDR